MADPTPKSCIPGEPLIEWGDGPCPKLQCDIPITTCIEPIGRIKCPIDISKFKPATLIPPTVSFWTAIREIDEEDIAQGIMNDLESGVTTSLFIDNIQQLVRSLPDSVTQSVELPKTSDDNSNAYLRASFMGNTNVAKVMTKQNKGIDINYVTAKIQAGFRPMVVRGLSGQSKIRFMPQPATVAPGIYIIEEYKVCSYLGDYGAGKTIDSFTLLPGEKTTISVKTWRDSERTRMKSENILDSFTETSADELENYIQNESGAANSISTTVSGETNSELSVGGNIMEILDVSASAGFSISSSLTLKRDTFANSLASALSKHISTSNHSREVNVNTSTSETVREGQERSVVRQLENINYSRVLNFVFRQLLQEYIVLTYLNDVKIMYTNGYPESVKVVSLPELKDLLNEVINPADVISVFDDIINKLCKVYNYNDDKLTFIEEVTEDQGGCIGPPTQIKYWRKRKTLEDKYQGIKVNGVILDVKNYTLKTPAVIVDALLGNGEALDCYNMRLQDAAAKEAELANQITEQMMSIVGAIPDPEKAAKLYKKVFGTCCDVPQSGCGCCNCSETPVPPVNP